MASSILKLFLCTTATFAAAAALFGHAGHDHGEGAFAGASAGGPVRISEHIARNLGLRTEAADIRPLDRIVGALGVIEAAPDRRATLSARVAGRIVELRAEPGQAVRAGDTLAWIETYQVGDPPPRVLLKAPIDGIVRAVHAMPGQGIGAGDAVLEIIDLSSVHAVGQAFERDTALLREGLPVRVRMESDRGTVFEGVIASFAGELDAASGTWSFRVPLENPDLRLRPGMRARFVVVVEEVASAVAVPRTALLGDMGDYRVYVRSFDDPELYEPHPVVVGIRDDRYVEIIDGILPGDEVVTRGNYPLQFAAAVQENDDHGHDHGEGTNTADNDHDHHHHHFYESPWVWMGGALVIVLALNAGGLLLRRNRGADGSSGQGEA